jgi:hypothetical protein
LGADAVLALTGVTFLAVDGLPGVAVIPVFLIAPGFGADDTFLTGAVTLFFRGAAADFVLGAGSAFFGAVPCTFLWATVLLVVFNVFDASVVGGARYTRGLVTVVFPVLFPPESPRGLAAVCARLPVADVQSISPFP